MGDGMILAIVFIEINDRFLNGTEIPGGCKNGGVERGRITGGCYFKGSTAEMPDVDIVRVESGEI